MKQAGNIHIKDKLNNAKIRPQETLKIGEEKAAQIYVVCLSEIR